MCSVPAGVRRLLVGVALSALYSLLNQWFPLSTVISDQFNVSLAVWSVCSVCRVCGVCVQCVECEPDYRVRCVASNGVHSI